ncbi:hypothetical protein GOV14_02185 [Candidatus Pacearchaeota archaeon]|nr:hypothetical protein [Candidatus Pacearchaeota archaeon]
MEEEKEVEAQVSLTKGRISGLLSNLRLISSKMQRERIRQIKVQKVLQWMIQMAKIQDVKKKTLYLDMKQNGEWLRKVEKNLDKWKKSKSKQKSQQTKILQKDIRKYQIKILKDYKKLKKELVKENFIK